MLNFLYSAITAQVRRSLQIIGISFGKPLVDLLENLAAIYLQNLIHRHLIILSMEIPATQSRPGQNNMVQRYYSARFRINANDAILGNIKQLLFTDIISSKACSSSRAFYLDGEGNNVSNDRSKLRNLATTGYGVLVVCEYALIFKPIEHHLGAQFSKWYLIRF